jgi:5-methylcytosine-specific restriction endonuclease McrA
MPNGAGHGGHLYRQLRERVLSQRPLICHICRRWIDHELRFPHPASKELHCIIPVSQGGALNDSNCAPAHRLCNQKLGNKLPGPSWLGNLDP